MSLLEWREKPETRRVRARLDALPPHQVTTTIVCFEDQMRGWLSYLNQAHALTRVIEAYRRLSVQLNNYKGIVVLEFTETAATEYQRLKRARLRLGTMDLKIAAIALAHDATVLTRNTTDFNRIS
jgi:tRNA(fMet)-specific endonuclease VapC